MSSLLCVETKFRRLHWLVAARKVEASFAKLAILRRKAGFNPDQPRHPKGTPEGGKWSGDSDGITDPRVLSDATSDSDWKPGAQYAQTTPRNPNRSRAQPSGTPAQEARLEAVRLQVDQAIARVREFDGNWRPSPSLRSPDSIEGEIATEQGVLAEAQAHLDQLRTGIGGNFGPPLSSPPASGNISPQTFDGPALVRAYRAVANIPDLFGNPNWHDSDETVAVAKLDGFTVFGINSGAPGYETSDRLKAGELRWALINDDPDLSVRGNIGQIPYNSMYHAEATVLIRSAEQSGGTLAGKTLEIYVDREMCVSCEQVLPRLGLKLGDPVVIFQDSFGSKRTMWNGRWLQEPAK